MTEALHLLRLAVDQRRLFSLAATLGLSRHHTELNYLVHTAMARLFGGHTPKPFYADTEPSGSSPSHLPIWAYTQNDANSLRQCAETFGSPEAWRCFDWQTFASKPMPRQWRTEQRLGFTVRACPVRRLARGASHHRSGAEVDAFLLECERQGTATVVDRQAVYCAWLAEQLARQGAAKLCNARLTQFDQGLLTRRTQGDRRIAPPLRKPSAILRGELRIDDPAAFAALLQRGIGRHRAFGFGMLLLHPPSTGAGC